MKNVCVLPKKSGENVPSKCYRSMILRNGKFLLTVGKSERTVGFCKVDFKLSEVDDVRSPSKCKGKP